MPNWFSIVYDNTPPSSASVLIENGAVYTAQQLVNLTISATGSDIYQMKIYGDVDSSYDPNVQTTAGASSWITYATSKQIKLSSGDGIKTIYLIVRDDVYNETNPVSDTIQLDTSLPVVTLTTDGVTKISKQAGKDTISFSFSADTPFVEYKVKVVSSGSATHDTGVVIPTTNGSTNMSGVNESTPFAAGVNINCVIKGADLEAASSGDGTKIVKVFVRESGTNNWSV